MIEVFNEAEDHVAGLGIAGVLINLRINIADSVACGERLSVFACSLFAFGHAIAIGHPLAIVPHRCEGGRIGGTLQFLTDREQVTDVHGKGDHAQHNNRQQGSEDCNGSSTCSRLDSRSKDSSIHDGVPLLHSAQDELAGGLRVEVRIDVDGSDHFVHRTVGSFPADLLQGQR